MHFALQPPMRSSSSSSPADVREAQQQLLETLAADIEGTWPELQRLEFNIGTHGWAYCHAVVRVFCRRTARRPPLRPSASAPQPASPSISVSTAIPPIEATASGPTRATPSSHPASVVTATAAFATTPAPLCRTATDEDDDERGDGTAFATPADETDGQVGEPVVGRVGGSERLLAEAPGCMLSFVEASRLASQFRALHRGTREARHAQRLHVAACVALLLSCYLRRLLVDGDPATTYSVAFRLRQLLIAKSLSASNAARLKRAAEGALSPRTVGRALQPALSLKNAGVTSDSLPHVAAVLRHATDVVWVDLSHNDFDGSAAVSLAQELDRPDGASRLLGELQLDLSYNRHLQVQPVAYDCLRPFIGLGCVGFLDLSGTSAGHPAVFEALCRHLADPRCAIHSLGLRNLAPPLPATPTRCRRRRITIPAIMMQLLRDAIVSNRSLLKLDLAENYLDGAGLRALCTALVAPNAAQITWLSLSDVPLSAGGFKLLARTLSRNRSLQFLLLNGTANHAGMRTDDRVVAAEAIAQSVRNHPSLTGLYLIGNNLQPSALRAIVDTLEGDRALQRLDISRNWLDDQIVARLCGALRANRALTDLSALQMWTVSLMKEKTDGQETDGHGRWGSMLLRALQFNRALCKFRCSYMTRAPFSPASHLRTFDLSLPDNSLCSAVNVDLRPRSAFDVLLDRNQTERGKRILAWQCAALGLAFRRANRGSPLANSIMPLQRDIMQCLPQAMGAEPSSSAVVDCGDWTPSGLQKRPRPEVWSSTERFLQSRYARSIEESAVAPLAAAARRQQSPRPGPPPLPPSSRPVRPPGTPLGTAAPVPSSPSPPLAPQPRSPGSSVSGAIAAPFPPLPSPSRAPGSCMSGAMAAPFPPLPPQSRAPGSSEPTPPPWSAGSSMLCARTVSLPRRPCAPGWSEFGKASPRGRAPLTLGTAAQWSSPSRAQPVATPAHMRLPPPPPPPVQHCAWPVARLGEVRPTHPVAFLCASAPILLVAQAALPTQMHTPPPRSNCLTNGLRGARGTKRKFPGSDVPAQA